MIDSEIHKTLRLADLEGLLSPLLQKAHFEVIPAFVRFQSLLY